MDAAKMGAESGSDKETGMRLLQLMLKGLFGLASMLALAVLSAFIVGLIVMLLWNWLVPVFVPTLPVAQKITYWQGWGLTFLLSILLPKGK